MLELAVITAAAATAQPTADPAIEAASARTSPRSPVSNTVTGPVDIGGLLQFRYTANQTNGQPTDDVTVGFETVRARLNAAWQVNDSTEAYVQTGLLNNGRVRLLDAYATFDLAEGVDLRIGQQRLNFNREFQLSVTRQLGAERSVVSKTLGVLRSEAVSLRVARDRYRGEFSVSDGNAATFTSFNSPLEANFALTARGETLLLGEDFSPFGDMTSFPGTDPATMLGFGIQYQDGDAGLRDALRLTADVSFDGDGVNGHLAGYVLSEPNSDGRPTDFGVLTQGGVFVSERVELFGRYGVVIPDFERQRDEPFHEVTAGVTHYVIPESHALKLTFEASYFPSDLSDGIAVRSTSSGMVPTDDAQSIVRFHVQLLF